jgi:hypothetical protein
MDIHLVATEAVALYEGRLIRFTGCDFPLRAH